MIATPDIDLGQCVVGNRVVQWDRMRNAVRDADGVAPDLVGRVAALAANRTRCGADGRL